jgi:hypothetical protein
VEDVAVVAKAIGQNADGTKEMAEEAVAVAEAVVGVADDTAVPMEGNKAEVVARHARPASPTDTTMTKNSMN